MRGISYRSSLWREDRPPVRRLRPRFSWMAWYWPFRVYLRWGDWLLFQIWWLYAPWMARLEEAVGVNSADTLGARYSATAEK